MVIGSACLQLAIPLLWAQVSQVNTITNFHQFHSAGIAELVHPTEPARVLKQYALTSAYSSEFDDPGDWRLLGSNNGGQSWDVLDIRTNQVFPDRSQRRVYSINNQKAYNVYRLDVTNSSTVHLAELELMGPLVGVTGEEELRAIFTSSKEEALLGPASQAFDGDPSTRWLDLGATTNSCWIQCQYVRHAELLITNVSRFLVLARRVTTRNPLLDKAPQVLSNLTAQASTPLRILAGYALTSANDVPERDPRDWRLLGSNDGGKSWVTLDVRRSETFTTRFQRRVFALTNDAAYVLYRLQIDSVRVPEGVPGGATCVQLAEIEPLYSLRDHGGKFSLVVSAQGENRPMEVADSAFDGDAKTKWLDFAASTAARRSPANTNKSSWVQWQYLAGESIPVMNLHWLRSVNARAPDPIRLALEGIVVSWNPDSRVLAFLDTTGFQPFHLAGFQAQPLQTGDRIRICARPQFGEKVPLLLEPDVTVLGSVPHVADLQPEQPVPDLAHFFTGSVEGRVDAVSEDPAHSDLNLVADGNPARMLVRIPNSSGARLPSLRGARVRIEGLVQPVLSEGGSIIAGLMWVPDADHVSLAEPREGSWARWPAFSPATLLSSNAPVSPGDPIRLTGIVSQQVAGQSLVGLDRSNRFIVLSKQDEALPVGTSMEAIGFLAQLGPVPVLSLAQFRPTAVSASAFTPPPLLAEDFSKPVTSIRGIWELARKAPGKGFPVVVRGVITYIDLDLGGFYLQDGEEAILVGGGVSAAGLSPFLHQEGSYAEVRGDFLPADQVINVTPFVTILGQGRMPEPRRRAWDYLTTGADFNHWVEVEGVVSRSSEHRLVLAMNGGKMVVWINESFKDLQDRLLGSTVRVCGVCSRLANNRNTTLGLRLLVPSMENLQVIKAVPENPFALPLRSMASVVRPGAAASALTLQLVKTKGVVTYKAPKFLCIQDGGEGMRVFPRVEAVAEPGDVVEVVGFCEADGFSPKLVQAQLRCVGRSLLPAAAAIDSMANDLNSQDSLRVRLQGIVLGVSQRDSIQAIELKDDKGLRTFTGFLTVRPNELSDIPAGSRVQLTGVLKAETDTLADYGQVTTAFQVYGNSLRDLMVLERPPWWTARHTAWALGGLAAVLLSALAWAGLLRGQVRQRTHQLREEIAQHNRTEAMLEAEIVERKRVQAEVEQAHHELLSISRQAGMAEVATGVLHNVGNVLNSVNVGANVLAEKLRTSRLVNLSKAVDLMRTHEMDLAAFLTKDPKGRMALT